MEEEVKKLNRAIAVRDRRHARHLKMHNERWLVIRKMVLDSLHIAHSLEDVFQLTPFVAHKDVDLATELVARMSDFCTTQGEFVRVVHYAQRYSVPEKNNKALAKWNERAELLIREASTFEEAKEAWKFSPQRYTISSPKYNAVAKMIALSANIETLSRVIKICIREGASEYRQALSQLANARSYTFSHTDVT